MTCIVAIKEDGKVYMGADRAGSDSRSIYTRADPKIYEVGPFLFGFTTSFRMGQLLGHSLIPPVRAADISIDKFMSTVFIDSIRDCLKTGGFASKSNETEQGGNFLVAYEGRIFNIDSDYQVGESMLNYEAIGCGTDLALGSLFTTDVYQIDPLDRINTALHAAEAFSCGVRGPFVFAETK